MQVRRIGMSMLLRVTISGLAVGLLAACMPGQAGDSGDCRPVEWSDAFQVELEALVPVDSTEVEISVPDSGICATPTNPEASFSNSHAPEVVRRSVVEAGIEDGWQVPPDSCVTKDVNGYRTVLFLTDFDGGEWNLQGNIARSDVPRVYGCLRGGGG